MKMQTLKSSKLLRNSRDLLPNHDSYLTQGSRWEKKCDVIYECLGCIAMQPSPKYLMWLSLYAGINLCFDISLCVISL